MEENHNSKQKKSLIKGFIQNIASLLKYSDFPFFKLRNEFLSLAELALEKGYDDWVGGELIIKKTLRDEYDILFTLYFQIHSSQKMFKIEHRINVGNLRYISPQVEVPLMKDGAVEIVLTENDIVDLVNSERLPIKGAISFEKLRQTFKDKKNHKKIEIIDKLFYYRLDFYVESSDNCQESMIFFDTITDLPDSIKVRLQKCQKVYFSFDL